MSPILSVISIVIISKVVIINVIKSSVKICIMKLSIIDVNVSLCIGTLIRTKHRIIDLNMTVSMKKYLE